MVSLPITYLSVLFLTDLCFHSAASMPTVHSGQLDEGIQALCSLYPCDQVPREQGREGEICVGWRDKKVLLKHLSS